MIRDICENDFQSVADIYNYYIIIWIIAQCIILTKLNNVCVPRWGNGYGNGPRTSERFSHILLTSYIA